jgi:serine/threonine protein kinase
MPVKHLKQNEKTLNINFSTGNLNADTNNWGDIKDLQSMNTIINTKVSPKYKILRYLGQGIQGSLYLATDKDNKRYICKKIILDNTLNQNQNQPQPQNNIIEKQTQLQFELKVLQYLSNNETTREYVNPCLEHKILDNNVYTIFPVFDGYSLSHYIKYLSRLQHSDYYKLVFHLIKSILHGMAKIHKTHIAHQNINENSILVSSNTNPRELFVKFTDFGLGCGYINSGTGNILDINEYKNDAFFKLTSCKENSNIPIEISDSIKYKLSESSYLQLSQKYDLLCLGMIFIKLLLFFDNLDIDLYNGYNKEFIEKIKRRLIEKYLSKYKDNTTHKLNNIFPLLNVSDDIKKDLLEYIRMIVNYIFCKTNKRKNCQYVLDKLVIYEKYKNDIF